MTEDQPPPRSLLVTAAAVLFSAITLVLFLIVVLATFHLLSLGGEMSSATAQTGLIPVGAKKLGLYVHDAVTILVGVGLLIVMVRAGQRLYGGSSSGRTTVTVASIVLSIGCFASGWMWGATVNTTGTNRFNDLDRAYMASLVTAQQHDSLSRADGFVAAAIVAVPLASLLVIILLNLPRSRDYFNAMLRSGTY